MRVPFERPSNKIPIGQVGLRGTYGRSSKPNRNLGSSRDEHAIDFRRPDKLGQVRPMGASKELRPNRMRVGPHTLAAATSPPPGLVRFQVAAILSATGVLSILNHLFRACKPALLSSDRAKHRWDRLMAIVSFADEMVRLRSMATS